MENSWGFINFFSKNCFQQKKLTLRIDSAASSWGQRNYYNTRALYML